MKAENTDLFHNVQKNIISSQSNILIFEFKASFEIQMDILQQNVTVKI